MKYPNAAEIERSKQATAALQQSIAAGHERRVERERRERERLKELWAGVDVGAVVRLDQSMTRRRYEVDLAHDGHAVLMDGVVERIDGQKAWVRIKLQRCDVLELVDREVIVDVIDGAASRWGSAKEAIQTMIERDELQRVMPRKVEYWDVEAG